MVALIQYWHEPEVPDDVAELMQVCREINADMDYQLFDRATAGRLINAVLGDSGRRAFDACAVPAMQADFFRLCALQQSPALYVDADVRCLQPLRGLLDEHWQLQLFLRPGGSPVPTSVMIANQGQTAYFRAAASMAQRAISLRVQESVWLTSGPGLTTFLYQWGRASPEEESAVVADWLEVGPLSVTAWLEALTEVDRLKILEGIQFRPDAALVPFLLESDARLAYRATPQHWLNWDGDHFARPPVP